MRDINSLIFGYLDIKVDAGDAARCADLLLAAGICAKITADGSLRIGARSAESAKAALSDKISFSVSEVRGLYGFLLKLRFRVGFLSAVTITLILLLFSSGVVWDVRVEGVDGEACERITDQLAECGLRVGALWNRIDKSSVEVNTLKISDEVAWININRRGSVAYVTVAPKETYDEQVDPVGYANIVAAFDCVIEEVLVERGVAVVKAGQTVKKGDLLISGVIPSELGGGAVYASGTVRGRYSAVEEVSLSDKGSRKNVGDPQLVGYAINFFGFSINILQKYSNFNEQCAIIEEKSEFCCLLGKKLPLSLQKSYAAVYSTEEFIYTADELCKEASRLLRERILSLAAGGDLLRATTSGEFFDGGYRMRAELILSGEVGEIREFELECK